MAFFSDDVAGKCWLAGRPIIWPARDNAMMSVASHLSLDLPSGVLFSITYEYRNMRV